MNRNILLIEPNYRNKYPPIGLMKLATYYKSLGDNVRFYKGNLNELALEILFENFFKELNQKDLAEYSKQFKRYIKNGQFSELNVIHDFRSKTNDELIKKYHLKYKQKDYPKFDIICISTLFTFYSKKTIETINQAKDFSNESTKIYVGGIASSIIPDFFENKTGIKPIIGLLDQPGILDNNTIIIDDLPLDYSILDEIEYKYPTNNAYIGYTTRGCPRNCSFCVVSEIEPKFKNCLNLKQNIDYINNKFGTKKDLLLLDNNVLVSNEFNNIIDEIKSCGFEKGSKYQPENEYITSIRSLKNGINDRANIKKIIKLYDDLSLKLKGDEAGHFYNLRKENYLLFCETAEKENILKIDKEVKPLFLKFFKKNKVNRYVDFNQGIDARLINKDNIKKLAEINIHPLRIAFDNYEDKEIYKNAVILAAQNGITYLSNYLLYNYLDKPEDLYNRLKINIELCEKYNISIYSFPMKYHPIKDPNYFSNRNFIGKNWNRKFIRTIQCILNSTKGKVGKGKEFFEAAFGNNLEKFNELLWMPEQFIIYRRYFEKKQTLNWREKFNSLNNKQLEISKSIISKNVFNEELIKSIQDKEIKELISFYLIKKE